MGGAKYVGTVPIIPYSGIDPEVMRLITARLTEESAFRRVESTAEYAKVFARRGPGKARPSGWTGRRKKLS